MANTCVQKKDGVIYLKNLYMFNSLCCILREKGEKI